MSDTPNVLCVGTPVDLKLSRQMVLQAAGYDVTSLDAPEAMTALPTSSFDVMIISVTVPEKERDAIHHAKPDGTRVIQLSHFTPPEELLKLVQSKS